MSVCKIEVWQYVPEPAEDEPCFMTYKFAGTYDGQPFICKVSLEIDGRDGDYECIAGVPMNFASDDQVEADRWDDLLSAFDETPGLTEDMEQRSSAYYGD